MTVSCWYLVVESLGKWWVDCEGKPFGPFEEVGEATAGAIRLAEILGDDERQLQVMVRDDAGRFQIVWERLGRQEPKLPAAEESSDPDGLWADETLTPGNDGRGAPS